MEVTEDDVGFKVLIVELALYLPGFPDVWNGGIRSRSHCLKRSGPNYIAELRQSNSSRSTLLPSSHELGLHVDSGDLSRSMEALVPKW